MHMTKLQTVISPTVPVVEIMNHCSAMGHTASVLIKKGVKSRAQADQFGKKNQSVQVKSDFWVLCFAKVCIGLYSVVLFNDIHNTYFILFYFIY